MESTSFEYNLFFILTVILLATKLFLALFLIREVVRKKKSIKKLEFDFLFSTSILMLFLFISRLIFMYVDFFLTQLEVENYLIFENIVLWKIAGFIGAFGVAVFLFNIERVVLNFKLKGITAYLLLAGFIFVLICPVNSREDFELVSSIIILSIAVCVIIPAVFIYVGIKSPEIRKLSLLFALGVIFYLIGVIIISEYIVSRLKNIFGPQIHITILFLFLIFKLLGLILISYCATKLHIYNYFTKSGTL